MLNSQKKTSVLLASLMLISAMLVSVGCFRRVVFIEPGVPVMLAEDIENAKLYTLIDGKWVIGTGKIPAGSIIKIEKENGDDREAVEKAP